MAAKSPKRNFYSRYLWKEKHRKQYTFTKTKFAVGFVISVLFSVFMGSYFDQIGRHVLRQTWAAFMEAAFEAQQPVPMAKPALADEAEEEPPLADPEQASGRNEPPPQRFELFEKESSRRRRNENRTAFLR